SDHAHLRLSAGLAPSIDLRPDRSRTVRQRVRDLLQEGMRRSTAIGLAAAITASSSSSVRWVTVHQLDAGTSQLRRAIDVIRRALESAGVEFIDENGGGLGVRLPVTALRTGCYGAMAQRGGEHQ